MGIQWPNPTIITITITITILLRGKVSSIYHRYYIVRAWRNKYDYSEYYF